MKARVKITPPRMERLITGKTLQFKLPVPADEIEIVLDDGDDVFARFDRVFTKVWKGVLDRVEKTASAILR